MNMENPSHGSSSAVGPTTSGVGRGPILLPLILTNQGLNNEYWGSAAPSAPTSGTTIVEEAVAELTDLSGEEMESFSSVKPTQGEGETIEDGMDHEVPEVATGALTLLLTNQNNNANNANQPMNGTTVAHESAAELTDLSEGIEPPSSTKSTRYAEEKTNVAEQSANSHGVSGAPLLLTLLLTNRNNNANGQGTAVPGSGTTIVHEYVAELVDIQGEVYDLLYIVIILIISPEPN